VSPIEDLRGFFHELRITREKAVLWGDCGPELDHEFDVSPEEFLDLAELDFERGGESARINCITNAKRAFECQVDKLLYCVGYDPKALGKIQKRLQRLREVGFLAPRILRKINDPRSLLEHEYVSPSPEEAEQGLDLASLFIEATNRYISPLNGDFLIGNESEWCEAPIWHFRNQISSGFDETHKHFRISAFKNLPEHQFADMKACHIGTTLVGVADKIYPRLLRIALTIDRKTKRQEAEVLRNLLDAIDI
jgi:hypothetical protein